MSETRDPAAQRFEALFRGHYDSVLRYARRRVDHDTAQEIAAETFTVAWQRLDRVPADGELPWLLVTARHVLENRRRSESRAADKTCRAAHEPARAPRDPAERHAERDILLRAFAGLSERDRETLRLIAWDGLDTPAAARVAGVTRLAFAQRASRARRRLERALADLEDLDGPVPATARPRESY